MSLLVGDGPRLHGDAVVRAGCVDGAAEDGRPAGGAVTTSLMRTATQLQSRVVEGASRHGGRRAYVWLRPDGGAIAAVDGLSAARALARYLGLPPDVLAGHIEEGSAAVLILGCSDPGPQRVMILAFVQHEPDSFLISRPMQ